MKVQAGRSLKASPEGLNRANRAMLMFATKLDLADELEVSRSTVQKFFAGKPVGRENFHKICQRLELPWQDVAELETWEEETAELGEEVEFAQIALTNFSSRCDIDISVQEVRDKLRTAIEQRCGLMRVLDMSQPVELNNIYTKINLLKKITGRRRLELADLLKVCVPDEFDRPNLGEVTQSSISGLDALQEHTKLAVLGKPGAGKTTFLKHIALQCINGKLQANRVPILIALKDFAETPKQPSLLEYIAQQFTSCGIIDSAIAAQILIHGRALVLLDGLDEVQEKDCYRVVQEIRNFVAKFLHCHFVLTCRIATREYTFEEFTEVEIADFDADQIASFAHNWFVSQEESTNFLQKLQQNATIRELATNPLLLTLICLVFAETASFPTNRTQFYKEGINLLLKKWDAKRNIEREQVYKNLSVKHKEDLLSQIAFQTFEQGEYFFRQQELEQYIADYIRSLPSSVTATQALQLDSEVILKSIEAQHGLLVERARGIYSFSHLTFHEYFTAQTIVDNPDPDALERGLRKLVSHSTEKRWREVFLFSVSMLRNADYLLLLMKQHVDQLLATDDQLQAFLTWVSQKARSMCLQKSVLVRAFYFDLDVSRTSNLFSSTLDLSRALEPTITRKINDELALDLALDRTLALNHVIKDTPKRILTFKRVLERAINRASIVDPKLEQELEQLKSQVFGSLNDSEFDLWWEANGDAWMEQLKVVSISYRDFGYDWQFSRQQMEILKQYYNANQLLIDCLNDSCYVSNRVRQEIQDNLLLPLAEIKALSLWHKTAFQAS
ncbi:putative signal transduction protein with Nacht domain [Gloeocapsa sp. PCC 7428]|uniref:NACHT domain-containing protein n=1 Tax=Gloeocapsa sp. PCC 7428 TaxID=1173026 RepID=UPI0002A5D77A|nr:NACHT domain-containing NTPase [Gloeocapsa sp. PCC 7428]AFZ33253.1 putative signal transduction protein with Nacht domain [Gloeocapsa sp. PCC 7428]